MKTIFEKKKKHFFFFSFPESKSHVFTIREYNMSVTGSMIAMEDEWPEVCVKDISGGLITTKDGVVSQWDGSTVGPCEGGPIPSCVSLNKNGEIPTYENKFQQESETDLLKTHVCNVADHLDGNKSKSQVREPSNSTSFDKMPEKSKTPLQSNTYDTCYSSLLSVMSEYRNDAQTP